jgi:hypothetical protein
LQPVRWIGHARALAGTTFPSLGANMIKAALIPIALIGLLLFTTHATANSVVIGGGLLTGGDANQLASWLGEGDLVFNNLYGGIWVNLSGSAFHAAADGQGRTFTVALVNKSESQYLIGGYNPLSWDSSETNHVSPTNAERTAFLYNLTTTLKLDQNLDAPGGSGFYQTGNYAAALPIFGGGSDLYFADYLGGTNYAADYSYGATNVFGGGSLEDFELISLNVYTIAETESVPEPNTLVLFSLGLLTLGIYRKRTLIS